MVRVSLIITLLTLVLLLLSFCRGRCLPDEDGNERCGEPTGANCAYFDQGRGHQLDCSNDTTKCAPEACLEGEHTCQAIFRLKDENKPNFQLFFLACASDPITACDKDKCVLKKHSRKTFYHCCCYGENCNANIIYPMKEKENFTKKNETITATKTSLITTTNNSGPDNTTNLLIVYILSPLFCLLLVASILFLIWKKRLIKTSLNPTYVVVDKPLAPANIIRITQTVYKGLFSSVHKAIYKNKDIVAVKILNMNMREHWYQEKFIYENCNLHHVNILKFINSEMNLSNNKFCIITEYHQKGSLADYLRYYTFDINILKQQLFSIISGLCYLHSGSSELSKPVITHRDLKSHNILVKDDLTCCIGDFGLAQSISSDNQDWSKANLQTGTKRYMAPEVLQGAIAFHIEAFLAVDMYAFALIIWETLSRCHTCIVPDEYQLPYWSTVGSNPTIEQMSACVNDAKIRPHIKQEWVDFKGYELIIDTMKECWDPDPDARLSACCVYQRFLSFSNIIITQEKIKNIESLYGSSSSSSSSSNTDKDSLPLTNSIKSENSGPNVIINPLFHDAALESNFDNILIERRSGESEM